MNIQRLNPACLSKSIAAIGADSTGQSIMNKKTQILAFEIRDLSYEAANILKQEALSAGAECATPKGCISHKGEHIALLFGTKAQLEYMLPKLSMQPFGLKTLKAKLKSHLYTSMYENAIMAIVNITPDSFYEDSRQTSQSAIDRINMLLAKEVDIIDIGAASSRPGSELIEPNEEIARLKEVVSYIKENHIYDKVRLSIDTYNPKTADFALSAGFSILNDVSGLESEAMIQICAKHKAEVVLMHTKGTPKSMQSLTHTYTHLFDDMDGFFTQKIAALKQAGIEKIILDIGFGFAKDKAQNIALIKHLEHFCHFDLPLLVGASRKNTIGEIIGKGAKDRLAGTLALHLYALQNGANILRVHDESEHIDMLKIYKAMQ